MPISILIHALLMLITIKASPTHAGLTHAGLTHAGLTHAGLTQSRPDQSFCLKAHQHLSFIEVVLSPHSKMDTKSQLNFYRILAHYRTQASAYKKELTWLRHYDRIQLELELLQTRAEVIEILSKNPTRIKNLIEHRTLARNQTSRIRLKLKQVCNP